MDTPPPGPPITLGKCAARSASPDGHKEKIKPPTLHGLTKSFFAVLIFQQEVQSAYFKGSADPFDTHRADANGGAKKKL